MDHPAAKGIEEKNILIKQTAGPFGVLPFHFDAHSTGTASVK